MTGRLARCAAVACVVWRWPWYWLMTRLVGPQRAFASIAQAASRWPGTWGVFRRRALLRLCGANLADDCVIEVGALLSKPTVVIGPGSYVGAYCCLGDVRIGAKSLLADGVRIPSGPRTHGIADLDVPMADQPGEPCTVTIGNDVWVGFNAVVMADVGDGSIVAAGAVVTRRVEPYSVVAGVPARMIRKRGEM